MLIHKNIARINRFDIKSIGKLFGLVYRDLITEEIYDYFIRFKYPTLDSKKIYKYCVDLVKKEVINNER
jgi:hypothetical protein